MANGATSDSEPDFLKLRLDSFKLFNESARQRFTSRRTMEWQVAIGQLTILGTLFTGAVALRDALFEQQVVAWALLALLAVNLLFLYDWLKYIDKSAAREIAQAYFWECCMRLIADKSMRVPWQLEPSNEHRPNTVKFDLIQKAASDLVLNSKDQGPQREAFVFNGCGLHRAHHLPMFVTCAVSIAIAFVVFNACYHKSMPTNPKMHNSLEWTPHQTPRL